MTTKVEKSVVVAVPLSRAYNQWTQFEDFPRFMGGVESVTQLADDRLEWVAEIAGVRRQWIAKILEQVPDQKVAWAAVEGATNAGEVTFSEAGPGQAEVHLTLEYEPAGFAEGVGDRLGIVERQVEGDLGRFKEFVEAHPRAAGAWRGSISEGATTLARVWRTPRRRGATRARSAMRAGSRTVWTTPNQPALASSTRPTARTRTRPA